IEAHELFEYVTLVEGSSIDPKTVSEVKSSLGPQESVLVMLDSNHAKAHVLAELQAYSPFVSVGSYIVAADGIMRDLTGAPRSHEDWTWNNPQAAVEDFLRDNPQFGLRQPTFPFNEGNIVEPVTYWPNAFLKRLSA